MRLALVAAILAVVPSSALASHSPVLYDTVLPDVFYVQIEGGGVKEATFVQPRADGMVALTEPDGTVEYVPLYRIQQIADQDGVDLTSRVHRREWLGSPPPKAVPAKAPAAWKPFRFRAGPKSECGSYLISDMSVMRQEGNRFGGLVYWVTDWGYARNIGTRHSLGATAFLGVLGDSRTQVGLRLRLARWFGPRVSFDLSPGVLLVDHEQGFTNLQRPGFSSQAGLTLGGRVGIVAQVFSARRRETLWEFWSAYPITLPEVRETSWHVGLRLGAEPGIIGSSAFLIEEGLTKSTPVYAPIR